MLGAAEPGHTETRTYSTNVESFVKSILDREGWQQAARGARPDFSMIGARKPLLGKAPPMPPEVKERARQYQLRHPPPPLAPIRMHAAPGLIALNDKLTFWLQLQSNALSHLHPYTTLLEDLIASGFTVETEENVQLLPSPLWFLKYRHGDNGRAVWCFKTLEELEGFARKSKLDTLTEKFIVQAGIRPLLLDGKKPVLRVFALVVGRRLYLHREFLIKVMSNEYSEETDDAHTHVECCAGQQGVSIIRGSEWSEYQHTFPKLCSASKQVLATYGDILEPEPDMEGCRYSLIGLDVLITPAREPILLEANCPPALFEILDDVAKTVKIEMQEDFYRFVVLGAGSDTAEHGGFIRIDV